MGRIKLPKLKNCVSSGRVPTPLAHRCSWWWKFPHILKCEVKTWWDMGMGHLWLKWVGHLWLKWVGHLWLKWVGHLWPKWVGHLWVKWMGHNFFQEMLKNTGLQGSTLSGPCMTTGFGPFELLTRGLLQKGRDHSLPKFCFVRSPPSRWHDSEPEFRMLTVCPSP